MPEAALRSLRAGLRYLLISAAALAAFSAILLLAHKDPLRACVDTFSATLATPYGFSELLVRMTPLLLTAVAVALPSRLGLINVGGEGQLYMGAWLASAGAFLLPDLPAWLMLPLMALLGFLGGALWAAIPGLLRAAKLVNETITTLLLNYVAPLIVSFFIFGAWRGKEHSAYPQTSCYPDAAILPTFFNTRIHAGLLLALAALVAYWLLVDKTRWGLSMRPSAWASRWPPGSSWPWPWAADWRGWRAWARPWASTAGCARGCPRASASSASSSAGWPGAGPWGSSSWPSSSPSSRPPATPSRSPRGCPTRS